jgi:hypothetical protein
MSHNAPQRGTRHKTQSLAAILGGPIGGAAGTSSGAWHVYFAAVCQRAHSSSKGKARGELTMRPARTCVALILTLICGACGDIAWNRDTWLEPGGYGWGSGRPALACDAFGRCWRLGPADHFWLADPWRDFDHRNKERPPRHPPAWAQHPPGPARSGDGAADEFYQGPPSPSPQPPPPPVRRPTQKSRVPVPPAGNSAPPGP